jgi:hypothetical protein
VGHAAAAAAAAVDVGDGVAVAVAAAAAVAAVAVEADSEVSEVDAEAAAGLAGLDDCMGIVEVDVAHDHALVASGVAVEVGEYYVAVGEEMAADAGLGLCGSHAHFQNSRPPRSPEGCRYSAEAVE